MASSILEEFSGYLANYEQQHHGEFVKTISSKSTNTKVLLALSYVTKEMRSLNLDFKEKILPKLPFLHWLDDILNIFNILQITNDFVSYSKKLIHNVLNQLFSVYSSMNLASHIHFQTLYKELGSLLSEIAITDQIFKVFTVNSELVDLLNIAEQALNGPPITSRLITARLAITLAGILPTRVIKDIQLLNFGVIFPLTINFIEHSISSKENILRNRADGGSFTDEVFQWDIAYLLTLMKQWPSFESLNGFQVSKYPFQERRAKKPEDKPDWAKKDIRDFSDSDMERLLEQWEEEDEPLPPDELPEGDPRRPQPKIDFSKVSQDPESILQGIQKGKVTHDVEVFPLESDRAIFMFKDGAVAWEAKDFLVKEPRVQEVTIEQKAYYGIHTPEYAQQKQKSEL
ncbi:unnamed protein product [Lepeophtheirus salmonis]|uniref:(salmon louse) hypothetical protein n=1 Tax=Lepeophtheirus salmonis TaxID=72036 RepID=A0A7R8H9D4_LEPSM|nr:unnamed protein product [Lepeophtheirus salmonis]CAF2939346.1 unnamed protein product [Lepeophtheirus salmonis]